MSTAPDPVFERARRDSVELSAQHAALRKTRGRGEEAPSHLATLAYLRSLEAEMRRVNELLSAAWVQIDECRDVRKCSKHMDAAQQRMHRVIKRMAKKDGK